MAASCVGIGALFEQGGVFRGMHRRQREAADARQQAAGEKLVAALDAADRSEGAHRHRHQQRVRPVGGVVEGLAGAVLILVHQRKAHRELVHRIQPQPHHRVGNRGGRAPPPGRGIGQAQQAAGERRIALHDAGDLVRRRVRLATAFHDRQRDALGAGQAAAGAQLLDLERGFDLAAHRRARGRCPVVHAAAASGQRAASSAGIAAAATGALM
jgi:hypothetical protein